MESVILLLRFLFEIFKSIFEIIENEIIIDWDEHQSQTQIQPQPQTQPQSQTQSQPQTIPNIIHFIYGFKEQIEEFELYRYIAIKSAYDVNRPDKIYFYYYYEPFGYWWDKIKHLLILEKINPPNKIYDNKIHHYAHKADIIRLEKLIEHGGIYLDIDTICLKSFSNILHYDFVMGVQNNSDNTKEYGLCNAVILSKPNSNFALKWLESYKTFRSKGRDEYWDEHSVLKPLALSKIYKKNLFNKKISKIKTKFENAIGSELAKNYYIKGENSEVRKINIDRKLVEVAN